MECLSYDIDVPHRYQRSETFRKRPTCLVTVIYLALTLPQKHKAQLYMRCYVFLYPLMTVLTLL